MPAASFVEPLYLGQGKADHAVDPINLDMGARNSAAGPGPRFGMNGFAPPPVPQPMALDPGVMIHQSEKLLDEAVSLRQENSDLVNQTKNLTEKAERLEKSSRESSNDSRLSASLAKSCLEETESVFNKTRTTTRKIEAKLKRDAYENELLSSKAEDQEDGCSGDLKELRNEVAVVTARADLLEKRVSLLDNRTTAL